MEKIAIIKSIQPYIQKFKNKIFIIKLSGKVIENPDILDFLASDISLLNYVGIKILVVHGGGVQADEWLRKLGIEPKYVEGERITDKKTFEVIRKIYTDLNLKIIASFRKHEVKAVGLSGVDGNLIRAKRRISKIDFGEVGDIVEINLDLIYLLLKNDYIPVICSLGGDEDGNIYNINADTIATEIAKKLKAEKLIMVSDVPGLLADPDDNNSLISYISVPELEKMIKEGRIKNGMIPKIENCIQARKEVRSIHIIDGSKKHSLLLEIFTDEGCGTMIVS